ncbi:protein FAM151A-like isoform X2 [Pollicipes pollicipes]|uniref:protein FAM151A-like isoform X2 n=1 Tax=Pollicipes pollicipes TaxID=41117 RepID=UPI00188572FF|nr:protein FAM151A-like isoform X2 [Pollicipes pollicipes]
MSLGPSGRTQLVVIMHPAFCGCGARTLRWAHAVNSRHQLVAALGNASVDALEADVSSLPADEQVPVMLHPPATQFLAIVQRSGTQKILKLDLKTDQIIKQVVDIILHHHLTDMTPLVLNADVVGSATEVPAVDAHTLLTQLERLQATRLPPLVSLGWCPPSEGTRSLTLSQISEMATLARGRPATLAVRADVALASEEALVALMGDLPGCGVTLWAHDGDSVCPEGARRLLERLRPAPVWLDMPPKLLSHFTAS